MDARDDLCLSFLIQLSLGSACPIGLILVPYKFDDIWGLGFLSKRENNCPCSLISEITEVAFLRTIDKKQILEFYQV